ncbi:hypothetical protein RYX36_034193, partial [Vicia faba]
GSLDQQGEAYKVHPELREPTFLRAYVLRSGACRLKLIPLEQELKHIQTGKYRHVYLREWNDSLEILMDWQKRKRTPVLCSFCQFSNDVLESYVRQSLNSNKKSFNYDKI